jgi:hypothetical protein
MIWGNKIEPLVPKEHSKLGTTRKEQKQEQQI